MNELSQYLVNQILLEDTELRNFVVVYSGRFQPFHKGHYATYQNLCKKFGKDKVFIGTSNKTDNRQSPFNFKEKKIIMTKMFGIPSNKIVEIKNPYAPTEILKNFDETTTGYISVVGEKDEMRLGGKYFEKYKGKIEQGYKEKGYVYVSPSQSNPISGTNVRNWLSKGDEEQQRAGFLKAYPKFDEKIFKLITLKLKTMSEGMPGGTGIGLSLPNGTINGAPKPEDVKKMRKKLDDEDEVNEEIKLDVNIGDTILMGKFKNKKTVVKTIGKDEHGMPTINGKKVATFRIIPKQNIFKEAATVSGGDDSQPDGGYLPKGKARVLGGDDGVNSGDDWFVRGGYTQTDFPKADAIYASDDENQITFKIKTKNNARSLNKPTTYPLGFDDVDVTQEIEKIEKVEKRLKKKVKQKDSISELISDYSDLLDSLFESDGEDDKYVHVGYGKYKEKSKKDVEGAPLFTKDDSGKYIPIETDDKGGEAKPTGQAIQGADMFKHDKSVKQPKEEPTEPTKIEPSNDDSNSKVKRIKGKSSGEEIQTMEMEGGGFIYGTQHGNTAMVDDILNDIKSKIPKERWKDIVFVGEGGATDDSGELEFNDEMDYAVPKFKEIGADVDTWDGDELDVHNDQSKLYKRQMEKTGLNQSQVNAGNWASMIGQGEGTDTMSPNDFLDDEGKEFLQDAAKEAGFPPIENWDDPTDQDVDTLYRLSFPEDNDDAETKVNDIQVAFNEIRDENIIEKNKELVAQGKIPITIAGEGHIELVDKMTRKGGKNPMVDVKENYYYDGTVNNYADWARTHPRKYDNKKANFKVKDSGQDDLEEIAVQVDDIPNEPLTEVKKESVVNYYKAICKDLNIKPIAIKFGSVGRAGAATTFDTKTFIPEYITFDLSKVTDIERAILHEITHQILLVKQQNPFHNCHKNIGFKKLENKLIDRYFYSSQSAVLREKVKVEMAKTDMDSVEKYADSQMSPTDVDLGRETDHFFQRLNDPRNGKEISPAELTGLFKRLARNKKKFLEFLKQYKEFVVKDRVSNINIAFIKVADRLIAKTVMRKADFKSSTPVFTTESINELTYNEKRIKDGNANNVFYAFYKGQFDAVYWAMNPSDLFNIYWDKFKVRRPAGSKFKLNPEFVIVPKKEYDNSTSNHYAKLKPYVDKFWDKLQNESVNESLIMEGGAYGHMNHPFDTEINLTFGQLKDIVNRALDGNLEFAREKTDGQALAISWIDGRLVAARNKSHLKNKGAGALDINGVADKFAGRGELTDAYNFAMKDLSNAIKSLSQAQKDKVFKNGACFMNIEVIYPTSVNVIPYGQPLLVFHGTMEYDENGDAIGESAEAGRVLGGMLKQVNADVQSKYTLQGPPVLKLPKSQDLSSKKGKYLAMISKLQKEFRLGDTAGVADYHQAWWENFVDKKSPTTLDNATKMGLVKRWAFGEKGFRIDKNSIKDEKTLAWATKIDKEDHKGISKDNLMKFEDIFLGVGADVLEFTASVLTVNPDSALREMQKRLQQTIKDVQASGDPKKIDKLKLELKRLNAIGGAKRIVPIEGIVFVYNGQTFKLTGAFASLNQLLGIFYA